jgi:hypothetical protein
MLEQLTDLTGDIEKLRGQLDQLAATCALRLDNTPPEGHEDIMSSHGPKLLAMTLQLARLRSQRDTLLGRKR